jgi:tRNA threonylcarbamoyladenosine biosynthesis protein TsaE
MTARFLYDAPDLDATVCLGRRLGAVLFPGAVVALVGPLGAGKTHFVRAVAEGLGVAEPRVVTSPTFVLIQEYTGRLPAYHFDAYRLRGPEDFFDLGAHEYFEAGGVCLVEWADRVEAALPRQLLRVNIVITGEMSRQFDIAAQGEAYEAAVQELGANGKSLKVSPASGR